MISDDEREDVWTFVDSHGLPFHVSVVLIDYPEEPHRSMFVSGVLDDGRLVYFENGQYVCDDGSALFLPDHL